MQDVTKNIKIDFIEKLRPLFYPAPYKIAYGGRGGGKTDGFAQAALILGAKKKLRIGCFREVQNSLKESVHQTLCSYIESLDLVTSDGKPFYKVQENTIRGANGTEFFFMGLRHNINSIKSVAKIDIAWVEEAQSMPDNIWLKFLPTIRGDAPMGPFGLGSEIWVGFNPELETDATYRRFVLNPPPGAILININYHDNKFFPQYLRAQMEHAKNGDQDEYENVWEGKCRSTLDGAIFAKQIINAEREGRISNSVAYDKSKPVYTFWDLGIGDHTAIWFVQKVGMEFNFIDFEQDTGKDISDWIAILRSKKYNYGICHLPHDGANRSVLNKRSAETILRNADFKVRVTQRVSKKAISITASRVIFDQCNFHRDRTVVGLKALRSYRYAVDEETGQYSKEPLHDSNSNAADAFQQVGLTQHTETESKKKPIAKVEVDKHGRVGSMQNAWMA